MLITNLIRKFSVKNDTWELSSGPCARLTHETVLRSKDCSLESDHESETFDSGDEGFATLGCTGHLSPETLLQRNRSIPLTDKHDSQSFPRATSDHSDAFNQAPYLQQPPNSTEAILHIEARLPETLAQPLVFSTPYR